MSGRKVLATDVWVDKEGEPTLLHAGKPVPGWAADLVTNPAAFVAAPTEGDDEGGDSGPYDGEEFTKEKLQELLKERELPTSGNKDELKARLVADDAEKAAEKE